MDNTNLSVALVEESYAARYVQGIGPVTASLLPLLKNAKAKKKKRWATYVEAAPVKLADPLTPLGLMRNTLLWPKGYDGGPARQDPLHERV